MAIKVFEEAEEVLEYLAGSPWQAMASHKGPRISAHSGCSYPEAMKTLLTEETVKVPKGCKISVKSKQVEVTGKHGSLKRDFRHLPIELCIADGGKKAPRL